jgi:heme exporter protein D
MTEFLAMGGYAAFVWPAYGVSVVGILAAVAIVLRAYARAQTQLKALESRKP